MLKVIIKLFWKIRDFDKFYKFTLGLNMQPTLTMCNTIAGDGMEFDLHSPIVKLDKVRIALLKEKVRNPNVTLRELSRILKEKYDISLSHTRIAEILNEIKQKGIMREVIIPNENFFIFAFLEMKFNKESFEEWKRAHDYLISSPNVIMFITTDGDYNWKVLGAFRSFLEITVWLHDFIQKNGKFVSDINLMIVYKILKFRFSPKMFASEREN